MAGKEQLSNQYGEMLTILNIAEQKQTINSIYGEKEFVVNHKAYDILYYLDIQNSKAEFSKRYQKYYQQIISRKP